MSNTRTLILPLGGGLEPSQYYTKEEIDQLLAPFITNTVDDLVNYYLKAETYTKAETEALVGRMTAFEVVAVLPTTDIKTKVIYLLGPIGSGADRYEEYIYSESTWVKIGETSIDLSNYVTTSMLSTALASYTTTSDLTTLLAAKADEADLAALESVVEGKQDTLTAGTGIDITNNVISAEFDKYDISDLTTEEYQELYENWESIAESRHIYWGTFPATLKMIFIPIYGNILFAEYNLYVIAEVVEHPELVGTGKIILQDGSVVDYSEGSIQLATTNDLDTKQDTLTAGTGIDITDNVISATGGGGANQWFGTQAEFDNLAEYDVDTDYFISDKIDYSEIKNAPDPSKYYKKTEVDAKEAVLDGKIASKTELTYMTQEEFDEITPLEGKDYMIEGDTVAVTFTFDDDTTATYYVLQDN